MTGTLAGRTELRDSAPLLVAGFLILFVLVGGGINTVSVFLNALSTSEGWSRKMLSAGISVGAAGAGLFTPIVGAAVDRWGVRVPVALGVVLLALGFSILLTMTQPWHFVAANALLGPGFASAAMLPITVAVTVRVPHRTALALGIVGVGSSVGALVFAPTVQGLVDALGWRGAYGVMGLLVVLTPIPMLLLALPRGRLQGDGEPRSQRPPLHLRRELGRPGVVHLGGLLILPGLAGFGLQVHLVPYLAGLGHATTVAAGALGAAVGISALGKLGGGFVADRIGALPSLRGALGLQTLAIAILPLAGRMEVVGLFVAMHGFAVGCQAAVVPVVALTILGTARFATLYGLMLLASTLAMGLAPLVPGVIFDATGSYTGAVAFWVAALGVALILAIALRIPRAPDAGAEPTAAAAENGGPVSRPGPTLGTDS